MIEKKKCTKCGEIKPILEFYKNKSKKYGYENQCKACHKDYRQSTIGKDVQKRYQQSKKGDETRARYDQSEKGKQTKRLYKKTEKCKQKDRRFHQSEKTKKTKKRYNQTDKAKQSKQRYRQSERGRQSAVKGSATRRTRETQVGGSYTVNEWYKLCKFYDFHCLKCGHQFPFEKLTLDHVKPISKGGSSFIWNTQPLCKSCNSSKGNKEIDYRQALPDWINRDGPVWMQNRLF